MKKIIVLILLFAYHIGMNAQLGYWLRSEFINLEPDITVGYKYVQVEGEKIDNDKIQKNDSFENALIQRISDERFLVDSKQIVDSAFYESKIYRTYKGCPVVILPRIVISMLPDYDLSQIMNKLCDRVDIESSEGSRYILKCKVKKSDDVLNLIQEIRQFDGIDYFEPEMFLEVKTNNTYYSEQYYLKNNTGGVDINVEPAWNITNGSSDIVVAVIDSGVEILHEDLGGRVLNGYTCGYPNDIGIPLNQSVSDKKCHGTACAGIIAASNNQIGIRGIASNVKLLPINIFPYQVTINNLTGAASNIDIANAIRWAYARADVLSCSWSMDNSSSDVTSAIHDAVTLGRSGKGCVVVFSSGNEGNISVAYPAYLSDVIAVGAVQQDGTIWDYSQRGFGLDLVAPSGDCDYNGDVTTLDLSGTLGETSTNYMHNFGGTSAACPQVAGVAALMLSVNPELTASEVKNKLTSTATYLGSTSTYGSGLVNAWSAVMSALSAGIQGPTVINSDSKYTTGVSSDFTVTWSITDSFYNQYCLQQNTPSINQCTILWNSSHNMSNKTLTAVIKKNSSILATLTKNVYAHAGFKGTYYNGVTTKQVNLPYPLYVKRNANLSLQSPNLINSTVTHEGDATVSSFSFNSTTGTVNFYLSSLGTCVVHVYCDNGDVYGLPFIVTDNLNQLNMIIGDGQIEVSLVPVEDEEMRNLGSSDLVDDLTKGETSVWTLEVYNATTGEKVFSREVEGPSFTIDTTGWKPGVYVVRAIIGDEVLNEKVIVK